MAGLERRQSAATAVLEATTRTACPSRSRRRTTSTSSTRGAAWTSSDPRPASATTAASDQGSSSTRSRQFLTLELFTQMSPSALNHWGTPIYDIFAEELSDIDVSGYTRTVSWRPFLSSLSSTWEICSPWRSHHAAIDADALNIYADVGVECGWPFFYWYLNGWQIYTSKRVFLYFVFSSFHGFSCSWRSRMRAAFVQVKTSTASWPEIPVSTNRRSSSFFSSSSSSQQRVWWSGTKLNVMQGWIGGTPYVWSNVSSISAVNQTTPPYPLVLIKQYSFLIVGLGIPFFHRLLRGGQRHTGELVLVVA